MADQQYVAFGDIHVTTDYVIAHRSVFDADAARKAFVGERVKRAKKIYGPDFDAETETEMANLDFDTEVQRWIAIGSLVKPETLATNADLVRDRNAALERVAELERMLAEAQVPSAVQAQLPPSLKKAAAPAAETPTEAPATK